MQTFKFIVALSLLILMGVGVLIMSIWSIINAIVWLVGQ